MRLSAKKKQREVGHQAAVPKTNLSKSAALMWPSTAINGGGKVEPSAPVREIWDSLFLGRAFQVHNRCANSGIYVCIYERNASVSLNATHFKVAASAAVPLMYGGLLVEYDKVKEYHVQPAGECNLLHSGHVAGSGLAPEDERRSCSFPIEPKTKMYLLVVRKSDDRHIVRSLSYRHKAFLVKDKHFDDELTVPASHLPISQGPSSHSTVATTQRLKRSYVPSPPASPRASSPNLTSSLPGTSPSPVPALNRRTTRSKNGGK
jgi:hypothetical protein